MTKVGPGCEFYMINKLLLYKNCLIIFHSEIKSCMHVLASYKILWKYALSVEAMMYVFFSFTLSNYLVFSTSTGWPEVNDREKG